MQAEKEAAAVFGRPAVQAVKDNPGKAERALLNQAQAVHAAIKRLRPLLPEIKEAVFFGQTLPPEVISGVIFLWLGYGKKEKTIKRLGLIRE